MKHWLSRRKLNRSMQARVSERLKAAPGSSYSNPRREVIHRLV